MTTLHPDAAVQLLLDRAELHDLVMRYASGVDKRDFDLVEACFAEDVDATSWGFDNRFDLMNLIRGVAVFHTTMHMMGNQFIEVDGDDAAIDTYAMLTHHLTNAEGEPFELNMSGNRYVEKLRRTVDGWVIVQRGGEPAWAPTGVTGVSSDDPAVRWLLDRAEIHDLMMRYALGIDLRDYERIRTCFGPSFEASYGIASFTDIEELINFIKGVEFFASTTHFLGNQLIEVDGDRALMETPAMITHRQEKDGTTDEWIWGGSTYVDALERVDGRWKIVRRGEGVARVPTERRRYPVTEDPVVRRLVDRGEIHDVVTTTAFATDRGDWDLYTSCFTLDGAPDVEALRIEGDRWHSTCHFTNNQLVDIDGDRAACETYVYVTHKETPEERASPWSKGARRFVDELVRTEDGWKIASRTLATNRVVP